MYIYIHIYICIHKCICIHVYLSFLFFCLALSRSLSLSFSLSLHQTPAGNPVLSMRKYTDVCKHCVCGIYIYTFIYIIDRYLCV